MPTGLMSGVGNKGVNVSSTEGKATSEGTGAAVFERGATTRVSEESDGGVDGATTVGIRITKSQLKKMLMKYNMSKGGCTEECKKRELQWQEEKRRFEKEMKDHMAKLKLVALNVKWIAAMVAEKLPNSALKKHVYEAMEVMNEICASKKTHEDLGEQVQANGTEKAGNGHSPISFSASTPGGAMRADSEPSTADNITTRAAVELGVLGNGSANVGSTIDRTRKRISEDTATVRMEGIKKCRKNGPQESSSGAFIDLMDDTKPREGGQEASNAQTSGRKGDGSTDGAVILSGGDNGYTQAVNQGPPSCTSLNDAMVVRVLYFRNESTGETHREHPLRLPMLNPSSDVPVLKIELGNSPHDVANNKRVLLHVQYDIASKDQKMRIFYYMRSNAEASPSYGWQNALCAPCTVGQRTKVLLVFDPHQNFAHEVLFAIGYVECGGGRRGRWSDVCLVNMDRCSRTLRRH